MGSKKWDTEKSVVEQVEGEVKMICTDFWTEFLRQEMSPLYLTWLNMRMIMFRWPQVIPHQGLQRQQQGVQTSFTRCLKSIEKVSFNIASEASYVYILRGQKLIKNAKNAPFWQVFVNLKLANSVTRQVSFYRTKIVGKCKNSDIQMRHFE